MQEKYIELAKCDFKCLEQWIQHINADRSRMPEKKEVRYKCKRDMDALFAMNNLFENIEKNEESFETFDYNKWVDWKQRGGIDLDDSNNNMPNPYIRAIYYILWGKRIDLKNGNREKDIGIYENGWERFSKSYLFAEEKIPFGGDTMNTIASYQSEIKDFREKSGENGDKVDEFCRVVHQLGNYVLVPAYFNGFRGTDARIKDCMDGSLCYLKENEFITMKISDSSKSLKEEKEFFAKKHFAGWEKGNFNKYINIFFLWDYVYANNNEYHVRNLKSSGEDRDSIKFTGYDKPQCKISKGNVGIYIENAINVVSRRSIFMTAMLMLAIEFREENVHEKDYEDKWSDWNVSDIYKYIVTKVFLTKEVYNDFNSVIGEIKGILQGERYKRVLEILDMMPPKSESAHIMFSA